MSVSGVLLTKKYIDQEQPYLIRQICVLQWEEIKTKEFRANAPFLREKGLTGWNKNILLLCFPYWPYIFALTWYINLFLLDCNITLGCSPFPSTSVGALGLFTFFPQCTVHNMCISELGVPVYSSLLLTIWLSVSGVLLTFWLSVSGVLLIYFIVCIRGPGIHVKQRLLY